MENNGLQAINLEELTQDWDKTANPMTVALAEGMENVTFTAHFKLAEVTLGEGAYLEGSAFSGITVNPSFAGKEGDTLPAGSRARLSLPLSVRSTGAARQKGRLSAATSLHGIGRPARPMTSRSPLTRCPTQSS